ncbi:MAG: SOS response-associated peptidase [Sandaracinaceae bacterium]|nr:SOS response-associated peptidase [Sandaracinaceae bacterium]
MCARYTMATAPDELVQEMEATLVQGAIEPHYNIAPTQSAPIVVESREGERRLGLARFGLVPFWASDISIGTKLLNARIETVDTKPAFRDAMRRHRCLVVADGFYEWRREGKRKVPFYFQLPGGRPFGMAGLWAVWKDAAGERLSSFTILTRPAEGLVAEIHDRMPILVAHDAYGAWLSRELTDAGRARDLLIAHRSGELVRWEVSPRVNDVHNDDASLREPLAS